MIFEDGTQVDLMRYGQWEGPFIVTSRVGRTPEHLVLRNPENGVLFEEHVDQYSVGYQIRPHREKRRMVAVTTTQGVRDASGEQVEVFTVGDAIKWDEGETRTITSIEYDTEDPNNMILFYGPEPWQYVHRMDAEHA